MIKMLVSIVNLQEAPSQSQSKLKNVQRRSKEPVIGPPKRLATYETRTARPVGTRHRSALTHIDVSIASSSDIRPARFTIGASTGSSFRSSPASACAREYSSSRLFSSAVRFASTSSASASSGDTSSLESSWSAPEPVITIIVSEACAFARSKNEIAIASPSRASSASGVCSTSRSPASSAASISSTGAEPITSQHRPRAERIGARHASMSASFFIWLNTESAHDAQ
ncbi:hypothetical protein GSI_09923 [Ganoderma sinense ZZ0214-1]|uniref:Uncharacterized protein n=1 Tax=Ganoderma sinense ZZ0214-1 TaxID=1077348 RepID=A0A2G8S2H9_9APHY|nr:hypothetical protein GSI_09923 [Ganoderma sinense ZZ0214-1]